MFTDTDFETAFRETVADFWGNNDQALVSACYRYAESHIKAGKESSASGLLPFIVGGMLLRIGESRAKQITSV